MVDLLCELEDPHGDEERAAELVVVESKRSSEHGTLLQLQGFGRDSHAKVWRLQDEHGRLIGAEDAGPLMAVSLLGFVGQQLPAVGTILLAADDEQHAKQVLHMREQHAYYPRLHDPTAALAGSSSGISMEERDEEELAATAKWSATAHSNDPRQLNVWIRADTWAARAVRQGLGEGGVRGEGQGQGREQGGGLHRGDGSD